MPQIFPWQRHRSKKNKNVVPYGTFTTSVFNKGQQFFARKYYILCVNVLSLLYHTTLPWTIPIAHILIFHLKYFNTNCFRLIGIDILLVTDP